MHQKDFSVVSTDNLDARLDEMDAGLSKSQLPEQTPLRIAD